MLGSLKQQNVSSPSCNVPQSSLLVIQSGFINSGVCQKWSHSWAHCVCCIIHRNINMRLCHGFIWNSVHNLILVTQLKTLLPNPICCIVYPLPGTLELSFHETISCGGNCAATIAFQHRFRVDIYVTRLENVTRGICIHKRSPHPLGPNRKHIVYYTVLQPKTSTEPFTKFNISSPVESGNNNGTWNYGLVA